MVTLLLLPPQPPGLDAKLNRDHEERPSQQAAGPSPAGSHAHVLAHRALSVLASRRPYRPMPNHN